MTTNASPSAMPSAEKSSACKTRRMARTPKPAAPTREPTPTPPKLDQLATLLLAKGGATIAEMIAATGWQQHSVRGAMAGALKKRGFAITSEKTDGTRRYRASKPA